jgi:hypothetical protein
VNAEVRERLAESKRATQKFGTEKYHLKQLIEQEGKEQYQVKISNRLAALEELDDDDDDDDMDINRACETIREKIEVSAKDSPGYHEFNQNTS